MSLLVRHRIRYVANFGDAIVDAVVVAATAGTAHASPNYRRPIGSIIVEDVATIAGAAAAAIVVIVIVEEIVPVQTSSAIECTASGRGRHTAPVAQILRRMDRWPRCTRRRWLG